MSEQAKTQDTGLTIGALLTAVQMADIIRKSPFGSPDILDATLSVATAAAVAVACGIDGNKMTKPDKNTKDKARAALLAALDKHWDEFMEDAVGSAQHTWNERPTDH